MISPVLGTYLTLGMQLAVAVTVFFFLGQWLDTKFGTQPWLLIASLLIGITGGFIKFFRTAIDLGRKADEESRRQKDAQS